MPEEGNSLVGYRMRLHSQASRQTTHIMPLDDPAARDIVQEVQEEKSKVNLKEPTTESRARREKIDAYLA
jgi:hypothetical protein